MGSNNHYRAEQFIDAIPGTGGIITKIAGKVGCAWHTAKKYIEEYSTVQAAYQDECEAVLDMAESETIKLMRAGDGPMLRYYLSTKGKDRGYTERVQQEITGRGGGPIETANVSLSKLTDEELDTLARIARRATGD